MKIRDCMKNKVFSALDSASIGTAAALFREHHIGTLPVVNDEGRLIGILRLRSLLNLVMPDFINLVENFEFVRDFGMLETRQPDNAQLNQPVADIMDEPVFVHADDGLVRAAAIIQHHDLKDLPVVDSNFILVGIASHVDVGVALMSNWNLPIQGPTTSP